MGIKRTVDKIILMILILSVFMVSSAEIYNRVVAIVNEDVITLHELNSKIEEMTGFKAEAMKAQDEDRYLETRRKVIEFLIDEKIGFHSPEPEYVKEKIGHRVKLEMLPYVLQAQTAERMYSKPRGYAGDYLTIHKIYKNEPSGNGRIGPLLDSCFLKEPAAKAR